MKTEIACGRTFEVMEPGDQPATKDPYMMIFWAEEEKLGGVLALVDLLHQKDREIQSWKDANDRAVELYEKRNRRDTGIGN
mgnify:CR=1 FL=1